MIRCGNRKKMSPFQRSPQEYTCFLWFTRKSVIKFHSCQSGSLPSLGGGSHFAAQNSDKYINLVNQICTYNDGSQFFMHLAPLFNRASEDQQMERRNLEKKGKDKWFHCSHSVSVKKNCIFKFYFAVERGFVCLLSFEKTEPALSMCSQAQEIVTNNICP